MNVISIILVILVAFLAGVEGILDEWEFHQPIIACTLIGLVTGHIASGVALGGSLQLIALGWMNIGAAVAPDAALASVVSALLVCGPSSLSVHEGIAIAIPLAVAGQVLTIFVRTIVVTMVHVADGCAERGSLRGAEWVHMSAVALQGLRIAIPTALVMAVSPAAVQAALRAIPKVITNGLAVAGGFIVAVGYAMVINMMASNENWPFFFLGFAFAAIKSLNLIAMGIIGLCLALVYLAVAPQFHKNAAGSAGSSDDELDRELEDL